MMPSKHSLKYVSVRVCMYIHISTEHIYTDLLGHCPAVVLVDFLEGIGEAVELACCCYIYVHVYLSVCMYIFDFLEGSGEAAELACYTHIYTHIYVSVYACMYTCKIYFFSWRHSVSVVLV